jgi:formate dehydrogenase subunit gamma
LAEYEPWNEAKARAIIGKHVPDEGAVLPALHELQETFGYISKDAMLLMAHGFNLSRAEIYGVVTFYHDFRREPPGRHILKVCRAEACQSVGGRAVEAHVLSALGVGWHGTTPDGAVTVDPVFCLGLCAIGPAAMLDGRPMARMNPAKVDAALRALG